jgi:hypothetical protein
VVAAGEVTAAALLPLGAVSLLTWHEQKHVEGKLAAGAVALGKSPHRKTAGVGGIAGHA